MATQSTNPPPAIHIHVEPPHGWADLNLRDLWNYRELLYFLIWRDIKVRYKQTLLGAAWAILQPFLTMVVFSIFFGRLAGIPSDGLPYPLFSFTALLPWQLFSFALNEAGNSVVNNQRVITKIYFPRLVVPISAVLAGLVDFFMAFAMLLAMLLFYQVNFTWRLLTLPAFVLLALTTALAAGLWLAALNVEYRDIRYVIPFLSQLWFFLTPISYPSSLVPENLRVIYALNPMVGVVEGFRWALLGSDTLPGPVLGVTIVMVGILLLGGLFYFRRMEASFADVM